MSRHSPIVSVVFPLPDHRGYLDQVLDSWYSEQTIDSELYEVLFVSGPSDSSLIEKALARMRPQDQCWVEGTDEILELDHLAAERASGEILLFTESHCIAHPDCIQNVVRYFEVENANVGQCTHINILESRFAEMEQMLEGRFSVEDDALYWHKVRKRGFAIRKATYFELGGFEYRFGYYSERAFAATLRRSEETLGWISDAVVYHYNTESLAAMQPHHEDYAQGMCLYRTTMSAAEADAQFGELPAWEERAWSDLSFRYKIVSAAIRSWIGSFGTRKPFENQDTAQVVFRLLARAGMPARLSLWLTWVRARLIAVASKQSEGSGSRAYRLYEKYWKAVVSRAVQETILANPQVGWRVGKSSWGADDFADRPIFGFYPAEEFANGSLRWTKEIAVMDLPCEEREECVVRVRLHSHSRSPEDAGANIRTDNRDSGGWSWDGGQFQWEGRAKCQGRGVFLSIFCAKTCKFSGDARQIGIAVEKISIETIDCRS